MVVRLGMGMGVVGWGWKCHIMLPRKFLALHHSFCQPLSSELDYIRFCYRKTLHASHCVSTTTCFLLVCKIPACGHRSSVIAKI